MQLKKAVKRIIALGTGLTMMGATVMGAMAADLSQYPAPFIKNGQFNAELVVGDNAKASDVIGSVDIATSLQYSMKQTAAVASTGGTQVAVSGDNYAFNTPGDMLEIQEYLSSNKESIISSDLQALQDGYVTTQKGSTTYEQKLLVPDNSGEVKYDKDQNDNIGYFLYYKKGDPLMTYQMTFDSGLKSTWVTSSGDTQYHLTDLEDKSLTIMGQTYAIMSATLENGDLTLDLLSGSVHDTLNGGESKTYTVDGKDYDVEVVAINADGSGVKLRINDEVTDTLAKGDTYKLADGTEFGVRDIIATKSGSTTPDLVEFYLGANKVELEDDGSHDLNLQVNDENADDATIDMSWTNTSNEITINDISVNMTANGIDNDIYVPAGHGVREYMDEPNDMFQPGWDITYEGLTDPGSKDIKIQESGNNEYHMKWTNNDGTDYNMPLVDASEGTLYMGTDSDQLVLLEPDNVTEAGNFTGTLLKEDDYFILDSKTDASTNEKTVSYLMQFTRIRDSSSTKEIDFKDMGSGETKTITWTANTGTILENQTLGTATLSQGGKDYPVEVINRTDSNGNYELAIDFNDNGTMTGEATPIVTDGGAIISFQGLVGGINNSLPSGEMNVSVKTLASQFDTDNGDELINFTISNASTTSDEVRLSTPKLDGNSLYGQSFLQSVPDNTDLDMGGTRYGAMVTDDSSNDAHELTISYPLDQKAAQVFVTAGNVTTTTTGAAGAVETVTLEAINVGSAVLASEVSDVSAQNLIMVGGPCASEVARKVMGVTADNCADGFTPGHAILKLYDTGAGHVALLVAGDQPMDTRAAARVLAQYDSRDLKGSEVDITYTSLSDIMVNEVMSTAGTNMTS